MKIPHLLILTAFASTGSAYAMGMNTSAPILDNSTYSGGMYPTVQQGYPTIAPAQTTYQVNTRLTQLESNLVQLRGEVNQQIQAINTLKNTQKNQNTAVNQRLTNLSVATTGRPDAAAIKVGMSSPNTMGLLPVPANNGMSGTLVNNTMNPIAVGGEKARYQNAYAMFRAGNVDQAMAEFQRITIDFPKGSYADNSQYWLGEAFLKKGDKQAAMVAFDKVINTYPESAKVPDAFVKIGITQLSMGNRTAAKQYFDYVMMKYPTTSAANIAGQRRMVAGL